MVRVGADEHRAAAGRVALERPAADRLSEHEPVGAAELRVHLQAQVLREHRRLLLQERLVRDALRHEADALLVRLAQALDVLVRRARHGAGQQHEQNLHVPVCTVHYRYIPARMLFNQVIFGL